jgi:hypothetical protein
MGFLKKLFGGQSKSPEQKAQLTISPSPDAGRQAAVTENKASPAPLDDGIAALVQGPFEEQLAILRYLAADVPFDRSRAETYIAMCEKAGVHYADDDRTMVVNPIGIILPKMGSDGKVLNAYEVVRRTLVESNATGLITALSVLDKMPGAGIARFKQQSLAEVNAIRSKYPAV